MLKGFGVASPAPRRVECGWGIGGSWVGDGSGSGSGSGSTKEYPFTRGVEGGEEMGKAVSEAVGRGRPARASWTAESEGDGGGSFGVWAIVARRVLS